MQNNRQQTASGGINGSDRNVGGQPRGAAFEANAGRPGQQHHLQHVQQQASSRPQAHNEPARSPVERRGEHHSQQGCFAWSSPPTAPDISPRRSRSPRCWPFRLGSPPPGSPTARGGSCPRPQAALRPSRASTSELADHCGANRPRTAELPAGNRPAGKAPGPCRRHDHPGPDDEKALAPGDSQGNGQPPAQPASRVQSGTAV